MQALRQGKGRVFYMRLRKGQTHDIKLTCIVVDSSISGMAGGALEGTAAHFFASGSFAVSTVSDVMAIPVETESAEGGT